MWFSYVIVIHDNGHDANNYDNWCKLKAREAVYIRETSVTQFNSTT
jgi:hypothetical protein